MAAGATVWLDDLPAIVASLERDWAITAGQTLSGGTDSYVAEVKATRRAAISRRSARASCWRSSTASARRSTNGC